MVQTRTTQQKMQRLTSDSPFMQYGIVTSHSEEDVLREGYFHNVAPIIRRNDMISVIVDNDDVYKLIKFIVVKADSKLNRVMVSKIDSIDLSRGLITAEGSSMRSDLDEFYSGGIPVKKPVEVKPATKK